MTNSETAAYIKGLIDGLGVDDSTKEGKVLNAIAELLVDLCDDVDAMEDDLVELHDQVDEIDVDLSDVEETLYDVLDDDFDDLEDDGDLDDWDDEDEYYELTCPNCGDTIEINEAMLDEELSCPNCGQKIEISLEEDEIEE